MPKVLPKFFTPDIEGVYKEPPSFIIKRQEENFGTFIRMQEAHSPYISSDTMPKNIPDGWVKSLNLPSRYLIKRGHPNIHPFYHDAIADNGVFQVYNALTGRLISKDSAIVLNDGQFYSKDGLQSIVQATKNYLMAYFNPQAMEYTHYLTQKPDKLVVIVSSSQFESQYYIVDSVEEISGFFTAATLHSGVVNAINSMTGHPTFLGNDANSVVEYLRRYIDPELFKISILRSCLRTMFMPKCFVDKAQIRTVLGDLQWLSSVPRDEVPIVTYGSGEGNWGWGRPTDLFAGNPRYRYVEIPSCIETLGFRLLVAIESVVTSSSRGTNHNDMGQRMPYSSDVTQYRKPFKVTEEEGKKSNRAFSLTKSEKVFYSNSKETPIWMGLELEVNTTIESSSEVTSVIKDIAASHFGQDCLIKSDASTGDYGFEIVTIPATLNYLKETIKKGLFDTDLYKRIKSTPRCGIHVHITKEAFTQLSFGKFIAFINNPNNSKFIRDIAGREENKYCMAWKLNSKGKADTSPSIGARVIKDSCGVSRVSDAKDHWKNRSTGNFTRGTVHVGKKHTIEVRIFKSSTSMANIFRKLEFCHALTKFVNSGVSIQKLNIQTFLEFVTDKTIKHEYPNLIRCLGTKDYLDTEKKVNPENKKIYYDYKIKAASN